MSLSFTLAFLIIIYIVGIVQAVVELKKGETVQFLDLITDTFVTPLKTRAACAALFDSLDVRLDACGTRLAAMKGGDEGDGDLDAYEEAAEEALYAAADIRKRVGEINRHLSADSAKRYILRLDSLEALIGEYYEKIQDREAASVLQPVHDKAVAVAARLKKRYRRPTVISAPGLILRAALFHALLRREYLRGYENELEETSVFATTMRPPMQYFRYFFLRDLGEKALAGRDGWLFYKPGYEYLVRPSVLDRRSIVVDPEDTPVTDNPVDAIVTFQNELAALGIDLLVMIVPGKASVYPDMLTARAGPDDVCSFDNSLKIMDALRQRGVETVDLFGTFAEVRDREGNVSDPLYLAQDTHWKARGLRLAAGAVADRVRQYGWFDTSATGSVEYVLDTIDIDRVGDVGTMSGLPDYTSIGLPTPFFTEKTRCYQVVQVRRDSTGGIAGRNLFRDDFKRSQVLVIGDSFSRIYQTDEPRSAGWIAHLAYELQQPVASIISDGGASTLVREKLARKSDVLKGKKLVVWEFIERDLRYGEKGWKDVQL